jgi:hypothetical protein
MFTRVRGRQYLHVCCWLAAAFGGSGLLQGSMLLNAGAADGTTVRGAGSGPGTGVSVATATTLTQMAISLDMPNGGNLEYMIWDGTDSTLLYSEEQAVSASSTTSYVLSTPFSFTLNAGSTYYFGVIGDNSLDVDLIFPATTVTENGLTTLITGNTNYSGFGDPMPVGNGTTTITLELFGTQAAGTPEPSTWLMMFAGSGLIAALRNRLV